MAGEPGSDAGTGTADRITMTLKQGIRVSGGDFLTTDKGGMLIKPNVTPGAPTQFPDGFLVATEDIDAHGRDAQIRVVTTGSMIHVRLAAGVRVGQRLESVPNSNSKFQGASHNPLRHSIIGTVVAINDKSVSDDGDAGTVFLGCGC